MLGPISTKGALKRPLTYDGRMDGWMGWPSHSSITSPQGEGWRYQISWIFGQVPRGGRGGSFSIQNLYCKIFGTLIRVFWAGNWFKSNFRVQGIFFQQLYWEKSKPDTLWGRHFWILTLSGPRTSINATISKRFAIQSKRQKCEKIKRRKDRKAKTQKDG